MPLNQTVEPDTHTSRPPVFANTRTHALPGGSLELLGAVSGVTGAMTKVELSGTKLLVDCGRPQGTEARAYRFPEQAKEVDAVVLTHGHVDHVTALPELLGASGASREQAPQFQGPIYATAATLRIAEIVLRDGRMVGTLEQKKQMFALVKAPDNTLFRVRSGRRAPRHRAGAGGTALRGDPGARPRFRQGRRLHGRRCRGGGVDQ